MYAQWTPDNIFATLRVTGSSVDGPSGAVLIGGKGIGGFGFEDPDAEGETVTSGEAFGAPGIVFRPRTPEKDAYRARTNSEGDVLYYDSAYSETIGAEAMSARMSYGLTPLAWRDLRWNRAYPDPHPGTLAFVGYAGSFVAHEDVEAEAVGWVPKPGPPSPPPKVKNARLTLYVPYLKSADDKPQKAHVIQLDPDGRLQIIQGDGYAISMDPENGIVLRSKTGQAWIKLEGDSIELVANNITARGNVALGANPEAGLPLLPGPASQPTPSVFFSPT